MALGALCAPTVPLWARFSRVYSSKQAILVVFSLSGIFTVAAALFLRKPGQDKAAFLYVPRFIPAL